MPGFLPNVLVCKRHAHLDPAPVSKTLHLTLAALGNEQFLQSIVDNDTTTLLGSDDDISGAHWQMEVGRLRYQPEQALLLNQNIHDVASDSTPRLARADRLQYQLEQALLSNQIKSYMMWRLIVPLDWRVRTKKFERLL